MNNFQNQHWNNNQQNTQQSTQTSQTQQPPNNQVNQLQSSFLGQIAGACLPVLLKQFVGQDMMPASSPSGNNMETQMMLTQVLTQQQLIINSQQALDQRLASLENNALRQFTNLTDQVKGIRSIRLTQEKKQIELQGNVSGFDKSRQFNQNTENYEN